MGNYYSQGGNATLHPFRVAYDRFEQDKLDTLNLLKMAKPAWDNYNTQMQRYERLVLEQQELVKLMQPDITADLIIDRLSK